jgi:hypothetical protein
MAARAVGQPRVAAVRDPAEVRGLLTRRRRLPPPSATEKLWLEARSIIAPPSLGSLLYRTTCVPTLQPALRTFFLCRTIQTLPVRLALGIAAVVCG